MESFRERTVENLVWDVPGSGVVWMVDGVESGRVGTRRVVGDCLRSLLSGKVAGHADF